MIFVVINQINKHTVKTLIKLIAQIRNISDYENKSEKDLLRHLANQN